MGHYDLAPSEAGDCLAGGNSDNLRLQTFPEKKLLSDSAGLLIRLFMSAQSSIF